MKLEQSLVTLAIGVLFALLAGLALTPAMLVAKPF